MLPQHNKNCIESINYYIIQLNKTGKGMKNTKHDRHRHFSSVYLLYWQMDIVLHNKGTTAFFNPNLGGLLRGSFCSGGC